MSVWCVVVACSLPVFFQLKYFPALRCVGSCSPSSTQSFVLEEIQRVFDDVWAYDISTHARTRARTHARTHAGTHARTHTFRPARTDRWSTESETVPAHAQTGQSQFLLRSLHTTLTITNIIMDSKSPSRTRSEDNDLGMLRLRWRRIPARTGSNTI